jgi:hypothetical protein
MKTPKSDTKATRQAMRLGNFTCRIVKPKVVPPKVKIVDAKNGLLTITTTDKTTKGKYELSIDAKEHSPIVLNVEII